MMVSDKLLKLLEKRRKLGNELLNVCSQVTEECEKLGITIKNTGFDEGALGTSFFCLTEPDIAYEMTMTAIHNHNNQGESYE